MAPLGPRSGHALRPATLRPLQPRTPIPTLPPRHPRRSTSTAPSPSSDLPRSFPLRVAGGRTIPIPSIGYGTWAGEPGQPTTPAATDWIASALPRALDIGYRQLDGAWFYGVDREVGAAVRGHGIPRREVFVTSKVWPNFFRPEAVGWCCDKILAGLGMEYVDLLLLHWPVGFAAVEPERLREVEAGGRATMEQKGMRLREDGGPVIDWEHTSEPIARAGGHEGTIVPTWEAMKALVRQGKTRAIGVSNFDVADLKALLPHAQDVPISLNQVEVHPWLPNNELVNFSRQHGILTSCFSPFAGQISTGETLIKDPTVVRVAEKNGIDMGQLLQSWAVQRGTIPLGKSGNPGRMKTNFAIRRLSDEDMKALNDLEKPDGLGRTIDFTKEWGVKLWQK